MSKTSGNAAQKKAFGFYVLLLAAVLALAAGIYFVVIHGTFGLDSTHNGACYDPLVAGLLIGGAIIVGMVPTIFTKKAVHDFVQGWKDRGVTTFFHRPNRRCYYSPQMLPVNFSKHFFEIIKDLTRFDGFIGADWDGGAQTLGVNWIADYVVMK